MTVAKLRVRASSIPWLMKLWEGAVRYDVFRHADFADFAADMFDGHCIPSDLTDLVRRRFLTVVPVTKADQTSISTVTWFFTPRGMEIMRAWRANAAVSTEPLDHTPSEFCCPNCGTPLEPSP